MSNEATQSILANFFEVRAVFSRALEAMHGLLSNFEGELVTGKENFSRYSFPRTHLGGSLLGVGHDASYGPTLSIPFTLGIKSHR
jgi:hypothetical protein